MKGDAIPTNKLRFVQRMTTVARETYGGGTYEKPAKVLQQWWEWTVTGYGTPYQDGEWRDVPFEITDFT